MLVKIAHLLFLLGFCAHLVVASESRSANSSAAKNSRLSSTDRAQQMPVITNEAEYAAWVRKREGVGQEKVLSSKKSSSKTALQASSSSMGIK